MTIDNSVRQTISPTQCENPNIQTQKSTVETQGNARHRRIRGRSERNGGINTLGGSGDNWEQVQRMRAIRTKGAEEQD